MLRWIAFALGVIVVSSTAVSVVGNLVVPRGISSRVSRACDDVVDAALRLATMRAESYQRRDRTLAWHAPALLVLRLMTWLAMMYLGFGLMLMPFVRGVGRAFAQAGSSMFTLGYAGPSGSSTTLVDYLAAFTGLIVVGLQIGYLPTLYAAFNRRETEVTLLSSRAGLPAWGPELLARTRYGIFGEANAGEVMDELFTTWERWAAEVAETHTTYLTLTRFRSPRPMSHWVTSLLAVMDAAALHLSLAPSAPPGISARLCLRMGFVALRQIGRATGRGLVEEDPDPDAPLELTYDEFESAVDMLRALKYPIERTTAEAWPHFRGWRVNYEAAALSLAKRVDAPPALWSGPRRWPSTPIAPIRPSNRLAKGARPTVAPPPTEPA
ncbi:MAG TPA: hypothetical protein VK816_02620 [Jatrophihabitantaceae bacterium]|jgi:hypothetical protein|nr:hypothetical protein [Jatrophihabitantaceae bacterium]